MQKQEPIFLRKGGTAILRSRLNDITGNLLAILDSLHDGLFVTDGNAVNILINQAYQDISGLRPEDVVGRHMQDIVDSGLISSSGSLLALKKRASVTMEQTFQTGKQALITSTPYFDVGNNISMVVTVVRDMTELYGLQEKYRKSEERRQAQSMLNQRYRSLSAKMVAQDPRTLEVLNRAKRVAALDTTVLLLGETGVGKEQFARFIYENSSRNNQSFISVNCGAIPPTLIESELFGYERGAFTGASKEGKMGVFESANNGTVFLDEIGDLPLEMQVHLLRVLQELRFKRVGGVKDVKVDVRVIAATNRDLWKMVQEKSFREDLYYRLNVVPIHIPPLRERQGDLEPMIQSFLAEINKKYRFQKSFAPDALEVLRSYTWPGNVRELKNLVEQAVIMSDGEHILTSDLPIVSAQKTSGHWEEGMDLKLSVAQFEYECICHAYEKYGNVRSAAASLGIDAATLVRKRKKFEELLQKRNGVANPQ